MLNAPHRHNRSHRRPCLTHLVAVGRISDALMLLGAHDAMAHSAAVMALGSAAAGGGGSAAALAQHELVDALYLVLRQMPHFRRAYAGAAEGDASGGSGRAFDNMAEFLAYRFVCGFVC